MVYEYNLLELGLDISEQQAVVYEARNISSVSSNKCYITKTPKCQFKPPELQKFKAKGVP